MASTTRLALITIAAVALAACSSGSNEVAPITLDTTLPPPTATSTTSPPMTASTTSTTSLVTSTTEPVAAVDATTNAPATTEPGPTGPTFSDALGIKVDTAPGVHTPGDTRQLLPQGLYIHIAWAGDPDDPSVLTARPDDIPILEAYANAVTTYYRAATTVVSTADADFDRYFVDGHAMFDESFANAREGGYVLDLGAGVVLRPYIPVDHITPTTAVVLDCYLEDQEYVLRGAQARRPAQLHPRGQIATMKLVAGVWKVDQAGPESNACV